MKNHAKDSGKQERFTLIFVVQQINEYIQNDFTTLLS